MVDETEFDIMDADHESRLADDGFEDDDQFDDEIGFILEREINTLAALFYQSNGRIFDADISFKKANHPEEKGCWNKAIIAYAYINKDNDLLKHQV